MPDYLPKLFTLLSRRATVAAAFIAAHLLFLLLLTPRIAGGETYGDVGLYRDWVYMGLNQGIWQGVDVHWVYPIAALLPMVAAAVFGHSLYMLGWFLLCTALNFAAVLSLLFSKRVRYGWQASYLFILLTVILGPLTFSRVDGISAPIVVMGLVIAAKYPATASALLSVATWIKVWPAAAVLALLVSSRSWLRVLVAGAAVSALMVAAVGMGGGLRNLLGFIQAQGERGMQLEAPLTTPGLWQAVLHLGTTIHPNFAIATMEIRGSLADMVGNILNPLLAVSLVVIAVLMAVAVRRGSERQDVLLVGSLALVAAMVLFNKVGSPQFMLWLAAVVTVGVAAKGWAWAVPVASIVMIGILTSLVYPILYMQLLIALNPGVALLLTIRNILLVLLFSWSAAKLMGLAKRPGEGSQADESYRIAQPEDLVARGNG